MNVTRTSESNVLCSGRNTRRRQKVVKNTSSCAVSSVSSPWSQSTAQTCARIKHMHVHTSKTCAHYMMHESTNSPAQRIFNKSHTQTQEILIDQATKAKTLLLLLRPVIGSHTKTHNNANIQRALDVCSSRCSS